MRNIGSEHFQRDGVAGGVEPFAAAVGMAPALEMHTHWVASMEQICFKISILRADCGTDQMGLATGFKLGFIGVDAAIGAVQDQHG